MHSVTEAVSFLRIAFVADWTWILLNLGSGPALKPA